MHRAVEQRPGAGQTVILCASARDSLGRTERRRPEPQGATRNPQGRKNSLLAVHAEVC